MNTTKKLTSTSFIKKCFFAIIAITITATTSSQQSKISDNWWAPIVKKHGLEFKSYTMRENYFIIGEKTLDKSIEIFTNPTIISDSKGTYWIYKSKMAYYDTKNRTLKIDRCNMEKFDKNSNKIVPLSTYPCVNYLMNFEQNTEKVAFVPPVDVAKK